MTRKVVVRALIVLTGVVVVLATFISLPSEAAPTALVERDGEPLIISINGRTLVDSGEVVDDVWVANGRATIDGRVEGSVIVLNGDAVVKGSVGGDITVVRGSVWIGPESVVRGDIHASQPITVSDGAIVDGSVQQASVLGGLQSLVPMLRTALWISLTVALFALGAIGLGMADGVFARARTGLVARPFGSAVWGLATLTIVPLVALITLATILGGLLGLLLFAVAALAAIAGLVVVATLIGGWIVPRRSGLFAFIVGALVLRIVALIPVAGDLATVVAALFGTGALVLARQRRSDDDPNAELVGAGKEVADATADPAINIDLRPGNGTPTSSGEKRLDSILADAGREEAVFDLRVGASAPASAAGLLREDTSGPEVLASIPVRDDHPADDAHGRPTNGTGVDRRVDSMTRGRPGSPLFIEPATDGTGPPSFRGPLFTEPDPENVPAATGKVVANGSSAPVEGEHSAPRGLFSSSARAWRPDSH